MFCYYCFRYGEHVTIRDLDVHRVSLIGSYFLLFRCTIHAMGSEPEHRGSNNLVAMASEASYCAVVRCLWHGLRTCNYACTPVVHPLSDTHTRTLTQCPPPPPPPPPRTHTGRVPPLRLHQQRPCLHSRQL